MVHLVARRANRVFLKRSTSGLDREALDCVCWGIQRLNMFIDQITASFQYLQLALFDLFDILLYLFAFHCFKREKLKTLMKHANAS